MSVLKQQGLESMSKLLESSYLPTSHQCLTSKAVILHMHPLPTTTTMTVLISMDNYHCYLISKSQDSVLLCEFLESGKECCQEDWKELWVGSVCRWGVVGGRVLTVHNGKSHTYFLSTVRLTPIKMPLMHCLS